MLSNYNSCKTCLPNTVWSSIKNESNATNEEQWIIKFFYTIKIQSQFTDKMKCWNWCLVYLFK